MCTVPVVPYGSMGTHSNHAVYEKDNKQWYTEKFKYKQENQWNEYQYSEPAKERKPVFPAFYNVQSLKELFK